MNFHIWVTKVPYMYLHDGIKNAEIREKINSSLPLS